MYEYFLYFVIYSFLGWVCETTYCSILNKKLVNRGFLNGPFCPIYGFGGLAVILILVPIHKNPLFIFIFGAIAASIIEYITSYLLELIFGMKLWDYSDYKYNLHGRVCLKNTLSFGLLSVALTEFIHPRMIEYVHALSAFTLQLLTYSLFVYFIIDFVFSTGALLELKKRIEKLYILLEAKKPILASYKELAREELNHLRMDGKEELKKGLETLTTKMSLSQRYHTYARRRILKAFPRFKLINHQYYMNKIKEELKKVSGGTK